jgi:hypothetical protein
MNSLKSGNEPAKGGSLVLSLPLVGSFPHQGSPLLFERPWFHH